MDRTTQAFSRTKYWLCRPLPPKVYWYFMGRLKPVQAVTSRCGDIGSSMASGQEVVDLLEKLCVLSDSAVTLHIGSGLGRVESHLARRVTRCVGIDVSASMVKRARELVRASNVEFIQTEGSGLGLWPDQTFDLIYSFFVFQHLPRTEYARYLRDAHAKLRPGGHLVFQVIADDSDSRREPPSSHPYALRYHSCAQVERELLDLGFHVTARTDLKGNEHDGSAVPPDVVFCGLKPA